jgi:hypothetical protein
MRLLCATALSLAAGATQAKSPLDGVWLADLDTQAMPRQVDVYLVKDGVYRCDSCAPPRSYPADGKIRPVAGDPEGASESVAITGPRTMVTHIVEPAIERTTTMTVAPDGRTATYVSLDVRPGVKRPLRTEYLARRTAEAPAGAHPVSGSWQGVRYVSVPDQVRTTELRDDGRSFSYRAPIGVHFKAAFGGAPVAVQGPYGGKVLVTVRRIDARTVEETRTEDGKVTLVRTYAAAPDGSSLETVSRNPQIGSVFRITSHHP